MSLVGNYLTHLYVFFPHFIKSYSVQVCHGAVSMKTCCLMELYPDRALIYVHVPTKQFTGINRINT